MEKVFYKRNCLLRKKFPIREHSVYEKPFPYKEKCIMENDFHKRNKKSLTEIIFHNGLPLLWKKFFSY